MTSSLRSRFDFVPRRALFITPERAIVYHWEKGNLTSGYLFALTDEGLANFEQYLDINTDEPVYILTDLPDEEFKYDNIPHVGAYDRKSVVARKQTRLFRNTKYSYYEIQGREQEGRRDDKILFSSITEDTAILPWINRLLERKVPVAGVYSVAMLSRYLLETLGHNAGPGLVVSLQRNAGLRQTFFLNKDFKFSRLARMPRYGTEAYAPIIRDEVEKMLRYLRSMRYLTNETLSRVYLIGDNALLQELEPICTSQPGIEYTFNSLDNLAAKLGLSYDFVDPFAEGLYAHLLLRIRPKNIYAKEEETRYYQLRNIRNFMLGSSVFILLAGLIWGGISFLEAVTLKQQTISAVNKAEFYKSRYDLAKERLPELPVEPRDLQTVVNIAETIESYKATPLQLMNTLSDALQQFPELQIQSIDWLSSITPDANLKKDKISENTANQAQYNSAAGSEYLYYQIAEVEGYISPFDGNYRRAITRINQLIEVLRSNKYVYEAKILAMPLDVSSTAKLAGMADAVPTDAKFAFRLVRGMPNEN